MHCYCIFVEVAGRFHGSYHGFYGSRGRFRYFPWKPRQPPWKGWGHPWKLPFEEGPRPLDRYNAVPRCALHDFLVSNLQLVNVLVVRMGPL